MKPSHSDYHLKSYECMHKNPKFKSSVFLFYLWIIHVNECPQNFNSLTFVGMWGVHGQLDQNFFVGHVLL